MLNKGITCKRHFMCKIVPRLSESVIGLFGPKRH